MSVKAQAMAKAEFVEDAFSKNDAVVGFYAKYDGWVSVIQSFGR